MTDDLQEQPEVPQYVNPNGQTFADKDQQKPLIKMLRKLMQPRHPRTRKFVKPKAPRRTKQRQSQYY